MRTRTLLSSALIGVALIGGLSAPAAASAAPRPCSFSVDGSDVIVHGAPRATYVVRTWTPDGRLVTDRTRTGRTGIGYVYGVSEWDGIAVSRGNRGCTYRNH